MTGSNVITVTDIRIDEHMKYVYGYDADSDCWILLLGANRARVAYRTNLFYKNNHVTDEVYEEDKKWNMMDFNEYSTEYLARYLLLRKSNAVSDAINAVYNKLTVSLSTGYDKSKTYQLHGNYEPGKLF